MGLRSWLATRWSSFAEEAPVSVEVAKVQSKVFASWNLKPYAPDGLVSDRKKGTGLYRDMLREPYVKGAILKKILAVVTRAWFVQPGSDDEADAEIAAYVEWALKGARGLFRDDLRKVLWALVTGVSINEMVFRGPTGRGRFGDKIGLEAIKDKDPDDFDFNCDDFGNVEDLVQFPHTSDEVTLDPEKFIIFSHLPIYGNPWGTSDFRAAYRAFWIKDVSWKFRAIFLERYGSPTVIVKFPADDEESAKKAREIVQSWQNETGLAIPETLAVEILKNMTAGDDVYKSAMADLNNEIIIGIQGAVLHMLEGAKTGSRAATQTHAETASVFTDYLGAILEEVVNERLIRTLVDFNYDVRETYPRWQFVKPKGDLKGRAEVLRIVVKEMGVPISLKQIREEFGIAEPEDGEELLSPPRAAPSPFASVGSEKGEKGEQGEQEEFAERMERRAALADLMAAEDAAVAAGAKVYDAWIGRIRADVVKKKRLVG